MRLSFGQIKHSTDMLISAPGVVLGSFFSRGRISPLEWLLGSQKKLCTHQQSIQRGVSHKEDVGPIAAIIYNSFSAHLLRETGMRVKNLNGAIKFYVAIVMQEFGSL